MSFEAFRQQMFNNASIHGGVGQDMLTAQSIKNTENEVKANERLTAIIKEAIDRAYILENDEVFANLNSFFMTQAHTPEGKERAIRMAIFTTQRLRKEFTIEKKK